MADKLTPPTPSFAERLKIINERQKKKKEQEKKEHNKEKQREARLRRHMEKKEASAEKQAEEHVKERIVDVLMKQDNILTREDTKDLDLCQLRALYYLMRKFLSNTIEKINIIDKFPIYDTVITHKEQNVVITHVQHRLMYNHSQLRLNPVVKILMFNLFTKLNEQLHTMEQRTIKSIMCSILKTYDIFNTHFIDVQIKTMHAELSVAFKHLYDTIKKSPISHIIDDVKNAFIHQHVNNARGKGCMCEWVQQNGNQCTGKLHGAKRQWTVPPEFGIFGISTANHMRCLNHTAYEYVNVDDAEYCKGCSNNIIKHPFYSTCISCIERGSQNRHVVRQNVIQCLHIFDGGKQCPNKQGINSEYCGHHADNEARKKHYDEVVASGGSICTNYVNRTCGGEGDQMEVGFKRCIKCRMAERVSSTERYWRYKNEAIEYNENNETTQMCHMCRSIDDFETFKNNKCESCYASCLLCEASRDGLNPDDAKFDDYTTRCTQKNIVFDLSKECAIKMFNTRCYYCDKLIGSNGIDRVDCKVGYILTNVVPCCFICNKMKKQHSVENFIKIISFVHKNYIGEIPNQKDNVLFKVAENALYSTFDGDAQRKRKDVEHMTIEQWELIISSPCYYCGNAFSNGARGIDRIDSLFGYIENNIVACCSTCNYLKNDLSIGDFYAHVKAIYNFSVLKIPNQILSYKERILSLRLCKAIDTEKFFKTHEFYRNLTFAYCDLNQIKKIKIKLEFIDSKNNPEQWSIWNYYRRFVSSFKVHKGAKLIGRQIYILVKDETTDKYLGIISLSSDVLFLEARDIYLGLKQGLNAPRFAVKNMSSDEKVQKIKYLMNMSTCIPLQPFGCNVNGGKLIASLAFSKEVLEHYHLKYGGEHLLGITTTSLYGKSIQYDRLPQLEFVGYTKCNGVSSIPSEVTKICCEYLKIEHNEEYPSRKKFFIINSVFKKLGISKDTFVCNVPKGIYVGYTYEQSSEIICGNMDISQLNTNDKFNTTLTCQQIFNWWYERWAVQRFNKMKKDNRLVTEAPDYSK